MQKEAIEQFIWLLDLLEAEALQEIELAERADMEHEQPITPADIRSGRLETPLRAEEVTTTSRGTAPTLPLEYKDLPPIRELLCQPMRIDRLSMLAHIQELGQEIGISVVPGFLRATSSPMTEYSSDRTDRMEYISCLRAKAEERLEHIGSASVLTARPWLTVPEIAQLYPGMSKNAIDCFLRRLRAARPDCRIPNPERRKTKRAPKFTYLTSLVLPELERKALSHDPTVPMTVE
jgi:hypothetical protein